MDWGTIGFLAVVAGVTIYHVVDRICTHKERKLLNGGDHG